MLFSLVRGGASLFTYSAFSPILIDDNRTSCDEGDLIGKGKQVEELCKKVYFWHVTTPAYS